MFNRHAGWMVVVMPSLIAPCLTILLMSPALAWAARRKRQGAALNRLAWTWDLAGVILGTLLLLGPLQAIHGFHPMAPLAVALGVGVRFRRWLVWRSPAWLRVSRAAGWMIIGLLPIYTIWGWHRATSKADLVWSGPAPAAPNLLWIVMDTVRADHMSVYGYNRSTTPQLDAWAKRGITFEMARSAAPWTLPSHVTMFTGLFPSQHGARVDRPYFDSSPTLAEHLRSAGYATGGIVANVRMCNESYGVGRGFDTYVDYPWNQEVTFKTAIMNSKLAATVISMAKRIGLPGPRAFPLYYRRPARSITKDGRAWLDDVWRRNESLAVGSTRPYFLFLNLMDAHGPYLPLRNATRPFSTGPIPQQAEAAPECGWRALQECVSAGSDERPRREQDLNAVSTRLGDLYDDCMHGMDTELGRFLGGLRDAGMLRNTWVVITSDHGEHFGEHGHFGHGSSLYNEMTHVPLILIPPLGSGGSGIDPAQELRGRRVGVPVSQRDLARTMAELLDPAASNPFPGRSLARYWGDERPERPDPVLSQLEDPRLRGESFRTENVIKLDSVIDEDHILIERINEPPLLYDLSNDPRQMRNLADLTEQRSRLDRMRSKLAKFLILPRAD